MALLPPSLGGSGAGYSPKVKGSGMDPLTIAALATSVFGSLFGGSGQQERKSYSGMASPQRTLEDFLKMTAGFGANLESQGPVRLRSVVPKGPAPVQIPGLNFQIGGGLGMDPALTDPSMLTTQNPLGDQFSRLSGAYGGVTPPKAVSRDRNPATGGPRQTQQRKPEGF